MRLTESEYTNPLLPLPPAPPPPPPEALYSYRTSSAVTGRPLVPPATPLAASAITYVIIPSYPVLVRLRRRIRRRADSFCCCFAPLLAILLMAALLSLLLWPTGPEVRVALLRLDSVHVALTPFPAFDISMLVRLRLRNPNFYPLSYRAFNSSVSYRGRPLGSITVAEGGGVLGVRAASVLDAKFTVDGAAVLDDVVYLIADMAAGAIPLETVTEVDGVINMFFFETPAKGKISCSVFVNPGNQKIVGQDCYATTTTTKSFISNKVGVGYTE